MNVIKKVLFLILIVLINIYFYIFIDSFLKNQRETFFMFEFIVLFILFLRFLKKIYDNNKTKFNEGYVFIVIGFGVIAYIGLIIYLLCIIPMG